MVATPELLKHTETLPCPEGCRNGRVTEVREYHRDEIVDRRAFELNCGRCGGTGKVTKGVHIEEETAPS